MAQAPIASDISQDDKLWALLSYLFPIIGLILLFIDEKKNRPFIKYHAVHAVALAVVQMILTVLVVGICTSIFYLIYLIVLGIKAYKGEYITIPWLTDFIKNKNWV